MRRHAAFRRLVPVLLGTALVLATPAISVAEPSSPRSGTVTAWSPFDEQLREVPDSVADELVTAVSSGAQHHLALTAGGEVRTWGSTAYGLGDVPAVLRGQTVTAVSAGDWHSLALTAEGKVIGWGDRADGRSEPPESLLQGQRVIAISSGASHSLALNSDGKLTHWGYNGWEDGEAGNHRKQGWLSPPQVLADERVVAMDAGTEISVALTATGDVVAWGYLGWDEWGPETDPGLLPVPDSLKDTVLTAVSTSGRTAIASTRDGAVTAWRWEDRDHVVEIDLPIPSGTRVSRVVAGDFASVAVTADGRLLVWRTGTGTPLPVGPVLGARAVLTAETNGRTVVGLLVRDDEVAPSIQAHPDVSATASNDAGAWVHYPLPAVTDNRDPDVAVACIPASGSEFPLGSTRVSCTATDRAQNTATSTFEVRVGVPLLVPTSGNEQRVRVGRPLPRPMVITVWGADGRPVAGAPVTFTVSPPANASAGAATFASGEGSVVVRTDTQGQAMATGLTGVRAGTVAVLVTTPAATPLAYLHTVAPASSVTRADLEVTVSAPKKVKAGRTIRATVSLINRGPSTAHDALVVVTTPPGFEFRGPGLHTRHTLVVPRDRVRSGQTVRVPVRVAVSRSAHGSRRLHAIARAAEKDPEPRDNRVSAKVRVSR